jgi:hypothetical protein
MTKLYIYKFARRAERRHQAVVSTSTLSPSSTGLARTRAERDTESDNDKEGNDDESESDDEEFENVLRSTPSATESTFPAAQSTMAVQSTPSAIQSAPIAVQPTPTAVPESRTSLILVASSSAPNNEQPMASFSTSFGTSVSYNTLLASATPISPSSDLQPVGALKESSSSMPAGRIAYISIGAIAGAACLAASIFVLWGLCRRRRRALREVKGLRTKNGQKGVFDQATQAGPENPVATSTPPDEKYLGIQRSLQQRDSISRITSYYLRMPKPESRRPEGDITTAPPEKLPRVQLRPKLGVAFLSNPRAQVYTTTGPAAPQAPRPTHTRSFTHGVPLLPDSPQPGSPPSTLSLAPTEFVPQNRASITPSESASNLPENRERIDREIEELQALIAARKIAERGGYGTSPYQNEQQWV